VDDSIKPAQIKSVLTKLWAAASALGVPSLASPTALTVASDVTKPRGDQERGKKLDWVEKVDTIIVPAQEDGFKDVFMGENRWYAIRIQARMISSIKYIAAYQVAPVSAVTHWAPVRNIEPWENTKKFVVNFAQPPKEIQHIKLIPKGRVKAPQAPRYASFNRLTRARTLDDLFLA